MASGLEIRSEEILEEAVEGGEPREGALLASAEEGAGEAEALREEVPSPVEKIGALTAVPTSGVQPLDEPAPADATDYAVESATRPWYEAHMDGVENGRPAVYANGRPITISADPTDAGKVVVSWEGADAGQFSVSSEAFVYAGSCVKDNEWNTRLESTSITMESGTVEGLFAGNHLARKAGGWSPANATIGTATVNVLGGTVTQMISVSDRASSSGYNANIANWGARTSVKVDEANINVSGDAHVDWIAGTFSYNYIGSMNVNVSGGATVTNAQNGVYFGDNGQIDSATMTIDGATVKGPISIGKRVWVSTSAAISIKSGSTVGAVYAGADYPTTDTYDGTSGWSGWSWGDVNYGYANNLSVSIESGVIYEDVYASFQSLDVAKFKERYGSSLSSMPIALPGEEGENEATVTAVVRSAPQGGSTAKASLLKGSYDGVATTVEGVELADLAALASLSEGSNVTVRLDSDRTYKENLVVPAGVTATIDLAGYTVDLGSGSLYVYGDATLVDSTATEGPTVSDDYETVAYVSGQIKSTNTPVGVMPGGSATMRSGSLLSTAANGVNVMGNQLPDNSERSVATFTLEGGYVHAREYGIGVYGNQGTLDMRGGVVVADDNAALAGNGTMSSTENDGGTVMRISGGTAIGHIVTDGFIACGIYHPQAGALEVTGGTIYADGGVGVLVRAGDVSISDDARIIATGTEKGGVGDKAVQVDPAGVVVDFGKPGAYPGASVDGGTSVSIAGGFIGCDSSVEPVKYIEPAAGDAAADVEVSGGTFSGTFSNDLMRDGYELAGEEGNYGVVASHPVASVDGKTFASLADAIAAAREGQTAILLADVTENVSVPEGKVVVLDLAGHVLTNDESDASAKATIYNQGTLTLVDSSEGKTGTVDNTSHAKAALYNEIGATATLSGGTLNRSRENGKTAEDNGGNSFYTVLNHGAMTVNEGVTVRQGAEEAGGAYSSLFENGWQNGAQNTSQTPSTLTINGGTFLGGLNTIKNDDWGELAISGGTFRNAVQNTVMNWNVATIGGGTFESQGCVVWNGYGNATMDRGKLVVTGGSFSTTGEDIFRTNGVDATIAVSGGSFNRDVPAEFVADGYVVVSNDDGTYGAKRVEARAISAVSLIAYEGGEGVGALPEPVWGFDASDITVDGEALTDGSLPFSWAWLDEDGNALDPDEDAGTGVYTLVAFADEDYAESTIMVDGNHSLAFGEDGFVADVDSADAPATVAVREVVSEEESALRPVFGGRSPLLPASAADSVRALVFDAAAEGPYDENGTLADDCGLTTEAHAHVEEGTTFYKNGDLSQPLGETSRVSLLWDEPYSNVLGSEKVSQQLDAMAEQAAVETLDGMGEVGHELKYADLVDAADGNAWVATDGEPVTVFWAYPEGVDEGDNVTVAYYDGLTRDYTVDLADTEGALEEAVASSQAHEAENVTKTAAGVLFEVPSGQFGPLNLMWQSVGSDVPDTPDTPDAPNVPDVPDTPDTPDTPGESDDDGTSDSNVAADDSKRPAVGKDEIPDAGDVTPAVAVVSAGGFGAALATFGALLRRRGHKDK